MAVRTSVIEQLATDMGYDGSESDSETFIVNLANACERVLILMEDSHEDGLFLDGIRALSGELNK